MPTESGSEKQMNMKIADRVLRDLPDLDYDKAANQAIHREETRAHQKKDSQPPNKRRRK